MKSSCRGKMHKPFFNSAPRRSVVCKRWTMLLVIWAVTALFAMVGTTIAAQTEASPKAPDNVAVGESEGQANVTPDFMDFMEDDTLNSICSFAKFLAEDAA